MIRRFRHSLKRPNIFKLPCRNAVSIFPAALLVIVLSSATAATTSAETPVAEMICNGSTENCARRFDDFTFPSTHNSMSNSDEGWHFANHVHGIERQLEDGVRAFLIDIYYHNGDIYMCHSYCDLGNRPLEEALAAMKDFMDRNPGEVIVIDFQSACDGKDVEPVFQRVGLDEYALAREPGAPWPTLGEMVTSGKRLVVFGGRGGVTPWFLTTSEHFWSSPYEFHEISEFKCGKPPAGENTVYGLQHFVQNPLPNMFLAKKVNSRKILLKRASQCWREWGQRPVYIAVDFYSVGDLIGAVEELNSIEKP